MNSLIAIARALSDIPDLADRDAKLAAMQRIWFAIDDQTWEMWQYFQSFDEEAVVTTAFEALSTADQEVWRWLSKLAVNPIPEPQEDFPQLFERLLAGRLPGDRLAERDVATGIYWRLYKIKPDDVIVDIGAHMGHFTGIAAVRAPAGRVLAFEPNGRNISHLISNLSGLTNVSAFPVALGAKRGTVTMCFGSSTVSHRAAALHPHDVGVKVDVEVWPLDEIWPADLTRCDLIKIDAESAENDIIDGATKTIQRFRPHIVIEVEHGHALKDRILALDYEIWGADTPNDQLVLGHTPNFGMWWCIPKEKRPEWQS